MAIVMVQPTHPATEDANEGSQAAGANTEVNHSITQLIAKLARGIAWDCYVYVCEMLAYYFLLYKECIYFGTNSLVMFGVTSFFAIVWFTALPAMAIVGFTKVLLLMTLSYAMAVFGEFKLAFSLIVFISTMFVWMHGSFYETLVVISPVVTAMELDQVDFALTLAMLNSAYYATKTLGWLGLLVGLNLAFISSEYFIRCQWLCFRDYIPEELTFQTEDQHGSTSEATERRSTNDDSNPALAPTVDEERRLQFDRLLNCTDHYAAFGLPLYASLDVTLLKMEYARKALLVHPDQNPDNERAAEAYEKLVNAFDVLIDPFKRKEYDDALRVQHVVNFVRRSRDNSQFGRKGFETMLARFIDECEEANGDVRLVSCGKCHGLHPFIHSRKPVSKARWCQECKIHHPAKDGDAWIEQSTRPVLFGLFHMTSSATAYICTKGKVYNATAWYTCQDLSFPANTHSPNFYTTVVMSERYTSARACFGPRNRRIGADDVTFVHVHFHPPDETTVGTLEEDDNETDSGMPEDADGNTAEERSGGEASCSTGNSSSGGGTRGKIA